ncbi:MAG: phosphotransferase [Luminiphilus sp.]
MAKNPEYCLASVQEVLDHWRQWNGDFSGSTRPELHEVVGEGTAHRVYALRGAPNWVLRLSTKRHNHSVNNHSAELASWRRAASAGLAPRIGCESKDGQAVITQRLIFNDVPPREHAALLRSIHALPESSPPLSLKKITAQYWEAIAHKSLTELALDPRSANISKDLELLDSESPCFCHNDLTPENIGRSNDQFLAVDWEYATRGNRHFDIAIASEHMALSKRYAFAKAVAGNAFKEANWQAACRVGLLTTHLWQLAVNNTTSEALTQKALARIWTNHE